MFKRTKQVKKKLDRNVAILVVCSLLLWIMPFYYIQKDQSLSSKKINIGFVGNDFKTNNTANPVAQLDHFWRETGVSRRKVEVSDGTKDVTDSDKTRYGLGNQYINSSQESHDSRRPSGHRGHVTVAETGSKDIRPQSKNVLSPMQKILKLSGHEFHGHVEDPDFKEKHNFLHYSTPVYLKDFKNPCLYKNVSLGRYTKSPSILQLRCVPYFMIAGFPKCGTTDLWSTLLKHPDVRWDHPKEINFFNKKHFGFKAVKSAIDFYQKMFTTTTMNIEKCVSKTSSDFHPCITGDASVDTIFDNMLWRQLPGNEQQTEPVLTNADYVHRINPNMKIIVLTRDPVERLYSDYLYMSTSVGYVTSSKDFHNTVLDNISNYTVCLEHRTQRACAYDMYDNWNTRTYKVRLKIGMYHLFLSDWLKVFPRKNVLVVKSEDMRGPNRVSTLLKIFRFLDLRFASRKDVEKIYSSTMLNARSRKSEHMLVETRKILTGFYKIFNKELETLFPHIRY